MNATLSARLERNVENLYEQQILNMVELELPGLAADRNCKSIFEAVVSVLIGTKQYRNGPTPDPEALVSIRSVVKKAMDDHRPIPTLVPFGGSKQIDAGSVDMAELMALKQIRCLNDSIKVHYAPGLDLRIRVEDATDRWLFKDMPYWGSKIMEYTVGMGALVNVILPEAQFIAESELSDLSGVAGVEDVFLGIIEHRKPESALVEVGWFGQFPWEQVDRFRQTYITMYPSLTERQRNMMLARYFAAVMVRRQNKATGADPEWNQSYLFAMFASPLATADRSRRLYYRSIPASYQKLNRSPWLSKGYINIRGNQATPALVGWDQLDFIQDGIVSNRLTLTRGKYSANVQADYYIAE